MRLWQLSHSLQQIIHLSSIEIESGTANRKLVDKNVKAVGSVTVLLVSVFGTERDA
jgi:hypothetical protein